MPIGARVRTLLLLWLLLLLGMLRVCVAAAVAFGVLTVRMVLPRMRMLLVMRVVVLGMRRRLGRKVPESVLRRSVVVMSCEVERWER